MPYQIVWPVPDHVIMVELSGGINAQEAQSAAEEIYEALQATPTPMIHFLIHSMEASINDKIWNYSKMNVERHPKVNLVIVIGDSRLHGLILAVISKIAGVHLRYSDSVESALKIISGYDLVVANYINGNENMP